LGRLSTLEDWLNYQESLHPSEIDLGLDRVGKVFKKLFPDGVPYKVITVAGTNGKGSTIAFINSILMQTNYKVGKFTSPHIEKYNERFSINNTNATDEQIISAFTQIEKAKDNTSLTYFEFSTLAALVIFANANIDIAILEIGLGGRLDSVNIVDPDVSVITNIAIDHIEYLGNTREKIGYEKAGIMRKNKPCVCADNNPPESLVKHAKSIGTQIDFIESNYEKSLTLIGEHQKQNAALAKLAIEKLKLEINKEQIEKGLKLATIPGRFEVINTHNKKIILDVAHNEQAVKTLASELAKDKTPTIAIFSALEDKNISQMLKSINSQIDKWLLVPLNTGRAIDMKRLSELFALEDKIEINATMDQALSNALNDKELKRIVVFGSFYTVADAKKTLDKLQV